MDVFSTACVWWSLYYRYIIVLYPSPDADTLHTHTLHTHTLHTHTEATVVFGGFSLVQEYSIAYKDQLSQVYLDLTNGLASSLDQELYLFGLPGRFASSVSRLVNR